MTSTTSGASRPARSAWSPLRIPMFVALWGAVLASNIGTWIDSVAVGWLVADMTGSAAMLGLVQAAQSLPVVVLALLAGALADVVDRRMYLLVAQLWMMGVATLLTLFALADALSPWLLIGMTFALGIGSAMAMPAQSATTPEVVPRTELPAAIALQSLGFNVARAIGPAIGGVVLAHLGPAWAFGINAASYLALIVVLWRWKRASTGSRLPPEPVFMAIASGVRYVRRAPLFRAVLVRALAFFVFATALPALLPLVAKQEAGGGPNAYGLLLAGIGLGAIAGAVALPKLKARFDTDAIVAAATLAYAATMVGTAAVDDLSGLFLLAMATGVAWIGVLASLQVAAQTSVPAWVRARAISVYIVVFSLGQMIGSLAWGGLAQAWSVDAALVLAAGGAVITGFVVRGWRIADAGGVDLTASGHWPMPIGAEAIDGDRTPAIVSIEYRVALDRRGEFLGHMATLGKVRLRDGALDWQCVEDVAQPGLFLEVFRTGSWLDHLRQHERVTAADRALQDHIAALHVDPEPPRVRHFVGGTPGTPVAPHGPTPDI